MMSINNVVLSQAYQAVMELMFPSTCPSTLVSADAAPTVIAQDAPSLLKWRHGFPEEKIISEMDISDLSAVVKTCRTFSEVVLKASPLLHFFIPPQLTHRGLPLYTQEYLREYLPTRIPTILKSLKETNVLTESEKKRFHNVSIEDVINDPQLLISLFDTAYKVSLVAPFWNRGKNGPKLYSVETLSDKVKIICEWLQGEGRKLKKLDCVFCSMTCLPREICSIDGLEVLYLPHNLLTTLPDCVGKLVNLTCLCLSHNQLAFLPDSIGKLKNLTQLYLEDNQLRSLPDSIGNLVSLIVLYSSKNQLTTVPNSIGNLVNLQGLLLAENLLALLPASIKDLENLKSLHVYPRKDSHPTAGYTKGVVKVGLETLEEWLSSCLTQLRVF